MEHVKRRHILPYAPIGSATFISREVGVVKDLIDKTIKNPDIIEPHRNDNTKVIFKKKFPYNIGRHGFHGAYCKVLLVKTWKQS